MKSNGKRPFSPGNSPRNGHKIHFGQLKGGQAGGNNSSRHAEQASELEMERRQLPMWGARESFLKEVRKHPTVVLLAETGSGKTTQVPQFLVNGGLLGSGKVAVTQPRRVAAVSLAKRVASEMGSEVGERVGYKVRFQEESGPNTQILFLTDGMLLREAMVDPQLSKYTWVVLDEAHERTVATDILFGVVKAAIRARAATHTPLKVVVMSATVDADKFGHYWGCPVLYVAGRQHAVSVRHISDPKEDWFRAMLSTIFTIHSEAPAREDVLVFMTGQEEIENMARQIRTIAKEYPDRPRLEVVTLYASKTPESQQQVFRPTANGCRKVVIATNIAETSVTIPGVTHVVDCCRVKAKVHQAGPGLDLLKVVKVSKAQARQRTGRAGREREGTCYRLLTASQFDALEESTVPEIQRSNLCSVALTMLSIGVNDILAFDFMDSPGREDMKSALRQLRLLGALTPEDQLTLRGRRMATFPIEPRLTAAILAASELGCTEEVVTIVALLSTESPLNIPAAKERREEAEAAHRKFAANEGDLVTLLAIWKAYKSGSSSQAWCREHFLLGRHLAFAAEIRKQLVGLCRSAEISMESSRDLDNVRKALAHGLFMNVAQLTTEGHWVALDSGQKCHIHPQSVLFRTKPEVVVYTEMVHTSKTYLKGCTLVDVSWLHQFQPDYFRTHRIK